MLVEYRITSLYRRIYFHCLCLIYKIPSRTFMNSRGIYGSTLQSLGFTKPRYKVIGHPFVSFCRNCSTVRSEILRPSRDDIYLNRRILSLKTVEEQLGLFESVKTSANIVNRVTMLFNIAQIAERDRGQKLVLEQEKETTKQGKNSTYVELLDSIAQDISKCQPRELANVLYALGKIEEKTHELVQVCEKQILSHDIMTFNNAEMCQILLGCTNLNLNRSGIFPKIQDAVLSEEMKIKDFEGCVLDAILLSFAKTDNGSVKLFDVFMKELLTRDISRLCSVDLATFVWSFAKKGLKADGLFDSVEKEILQRGTNDLSIADCIQILWAFGKSGKGSRQLFYQFDIELNSRGLESFNNSELLEIVWSFSKRNVTKAKVFELAENEIYDRGVHNFQTHELVLLLWSYVSAQRHNDELVEDIESELSIRDMKELDNGRLSQVVWCLGKARHSGSKLFDVIEAEVIKRGVSKFAVKEKLMLMRGFFEGRKGNKEFFDHLVSSFSTNDFRELNGGTICECAWCFCKANVEARAVFDALEKEILAKGKDFFNQKELSFIKHIFQEAGKGKNLFGL